MSSRVYIGLGGNLGDVCQTLTAALNAINQLPHTAVESVSSFYQSVPLGPTDQPDFINAVALLRTAQSPLSLLRLLQQIELDFGRERKRHWGERTLDLDILSFDNLQQFDPVLTLPHPGICEREFVVLPLAEIAADLVLPDGTMVATLANTLGADPERPLRIVAPAPDLSRGI